jgi:Ser/Thr protein kinase RdoA (MazF antagonist)
VGDSKKSQYRLPLVPATYGIANLEYLLSSNSISIDVRSEYEKTVRQICKILDPWFKETKTQRIHGDCHFGNLLFRGEEAFFIDFDDMVVGPPVQDVWLLTPGRDEYSDRLRNRLLSGYEQMREFDWDSLKLVEGLRALRLIHFSAWIAKRWQDPAFQRTFIQYGTPRYWEEQLADLKDQLSWIQKES